MLQTINDLKVGQVISNEILTTLFQCSPQGGMRRHNDNLVIISGHVNNIYTDRWIDGVIHYTGMGRKGDQTLRGNQNGTLYHSRTNGVKVYLFEVFKRKEYTFMGRVELVGDPYQENQLDEDNLLRKVWVFPMRPINPVEEVPLETLKQAEISHRIQAQKMTDLDLTRSALTSSGKASKRKARDTVYYERNQNIREFALRMAKGNCQLCENPAPFKDKKGNPHLEVHHIKFLSEGGEDAITNVIALCPNCHSKMHILGIPDDKKKIENLAERYAHIAEKEIGIKL